MVVLCLLAVAGVIALRAQQPPSPALSALFPKDARKIRTEEPPPAAYTSDSPVLFMGEAFGEIPAKIPCQRDPTWGALHIDVKAFRAGDKGYEYVFKSMADGEAQVMRDEYKQGNPQGDGRKHQETIDGGTAYFTEFTNECEHEGGQYHSTNFQAFSQQGHSLLTIGGGVDRDAAAAKEIILGIVGKFKSTDFSNIVKH